MKPYEQKFIFENNQIITRVTLVEVNHEKIKI